MPLLSKGWGGLFKDEQYRLIRSASRAFVRWLHDFEQTTPGASRPPLLLKEIKNRTNGMNDFRTPDFCSPFIETRPTAPAWRVTKEYPKLSCVQTINKKELK